MYVSLSNLKAEPFLQDEDEDGEGGEDTPAAEKARRDEDDPLQRLYEDLSDTDTEEERDVPEELAAPGQQDAPPSELRGRPRKGTAPIFNPATKFRLEYTLVICYLACTTLRVPLFAKDLLE